VSYDLNNPRYILPRGASFGTSFIPGLTQLINGEYVKGGLIMASTVGFIALSGYAASTGAMDRLDKDTGEKAEMAPALGALAIGGFIYSYIDGTISTHKLNNQKKGNTKKTVDNKINTKPSSSQNSYIEIINVPDLSSSDLYKMINTWFVQEFKGDSNIAFSDKDSGVISGNYVFRSDEHANMYIMSSTITVEIKDGRYRISCTDPKAQIIGSAWLTWAGDGKIENRNFVHASKAIIEDDIYPKWIMLTSSIKTYVENNSNNLDW
jgi:hypothetical protein